MTRIAEVDFETRASVDLKKCGGYKYAEHRDTDVMMASYMIDDDGVIRRWRKGEPCPADLREVIEEDGTIWAHSAQFERLMWNYILGPRYGWPVPRLEQFRCTAATAAALSLPRSLEEVAQALGLPVSKDAEGYRLMLRMSKPRAPRKGEDPDGLYWYGWDDPAKVDRLHSYCDQDVIVANQVRKRLVHLSPDEQELYWLDQTINDRGIRVDRRSIAGALLLAERAKATLDREMTLATGGYVTACSQAAALTRWVQAQGVPATSLAKADLTDLLETEDLPDSVRRALEIRQEAAKTSVAKIEAMRLRACADGRIRGCFMYSAAGTRRWSSVGVQLQNLPRPRKDYEAVEDVAELFGLFRGGDPAAVLERYGPKLGKPMHLLSDAVRGFLWAGAGDELVVADYSSIEGRLAAWIAGEEWKLEAMRANDRGDGPGMYELAAAGIYDVAVDAVSKDQRQVGKVSELALGYQGGVGAFQTMSRGYGLVLEDAYPAVWDSASSDRKEAAVDRLTECRERNDRVAKLLSDEAWLMAELVKIGWRANHPAVVQSWKDLGAAAKAAVEQPGSVHTVLAGRVAYTVRKGFLWCRLPGGGMLAYGMPSIREVVAPWADPEDLPEKKDKVRAVTALGVNSVTKRWERYALYGGLLFENVVQAAARDLLANGIRKAEANGYPVTGHVHDEIITERRRGEGDVAEFERLICELPEWAAGLPLKAAGWRGKRYRK